MVQDVKVSVDTQVAVCEIHPDLYLSPSVLYAGLRNEDLAAKEVKINHVKSTLRGQRGNRPHFLFGSLRFLQNLNSCR